MAATQILQSETFFCNNNYEGIQKYIYVSEPSKTFSHLEITEPVQITKYLTSGCKVKKKINSKILYTTSAKREFSTFLDLVYVIYSN